MEGKKGKRKTKKQVEKEGSDTWAIWEGLGKTKIGIHVFKYW